jgi:pyruvate dehydrogenase complex dehydrogenase (E1) component
MADAKLTLNVTDHWTDGKRVHVIGYITNDGGNYKNNGLPINMANDLIKGQYILHAELHGKGALYIIQGAGAVYPEQVSGGSLLQTLTLLGYSVPGTQLTVAAIPDANIPFYGIFSKLI